MSEVGKNERNGKDGSWKGWVVEVEGKDSTYACQLQHLSRQVLQHSGNINRSLCADAHLVLGVVLEETLDTSAWELFSYTSAFHFRKYVFVQVMAMRCGLGDTRVCGVELRRRRSVELEALSWDSSITMTRRHLKSCSKLQNPHLATQITSSCIHLIRKHRHSSVFRVVRDCLTRLLAGYATPPQALSTTKPHLESVQKRADMS
jgi:hypothetical protein